MNRRLVAEEQGTAIDRLSFAIVAIIFTSAALYLLRDATALPSLRWIDLFSPYDYRRDGLLRFLADLRLPVPPVLGAIEMLSLEQLGSTRWIEVGLYRAALIGGFLSGLLLIWPSRWRLALFLPLSILFVWAIALLNRYTPLIYDAVFPCLLMLYLVLHRRLDAERPGIVLPLAAGTTLALLELTRPFVLLLLPLFLLSAWAALRLRPGRFLLFLVPLVLLSGTWHAHQLANHGQLAWSNHAGFNLIRAWRQVPYPPLMDESANLAAPGAHLPNANTAAHAENSRRLQQAVLRYMAENPVEAAAHAAQRVAVFIGSGHFLEGVSPDHPLLLLYDLAVRYLDLLLLAGALVVVGAVVLRSAQAATIVAAPGNLALVAGAGALIVMALGESGEEARYQTVLLPLLACVPIPFLGPRETGLPRRTQRAATRWRIAGLAVALIGVIATEILLWGSRRAPAGAAEGGAIAAKWVIAKGPLRVVQASLHNAGSAPEQMAALERCLRGSDVVGLTEVRGADLLGREPDRATALGRKLDMGALFAPTERRWWHEHFGNGLLTNVAVTGWRREMLPQTLGYSHRGALIAEIAAAERRASVIVSQLDVYDREAQLDRLVERFRRIDGPAILLVDLGHLHPPPPSLARLLAEPDIAAVRNRPTAETPLMGRWIVARGFRLRGERLCPTGLSLHPELVADLEFID